MKPSCGLYLKQINTTLEKNANNDLREDGLTMSQVTILLTLNEADEFSLSLKQLEKELHLAQSTIAGIVSRLEQKNLISSYFDENDKRLKLVKLTDDGLNCCIKAEMRMQAAETQLLSGLTEAEQTIFFTLLQKVSNTIT